MDLIGSPTLDKFTHPKNKIIIQSYIKKLRLLLAILLILLISTNAVMGLTLTKTGNRQSAHFGDTVIYNYELKNDEGVDLHDVVFTDDHFGSIAVGNLANNAIWPKTISHVINASDMPGPLRNNAWATGKKPDNSVVTSPVVFWTVSLTILGSLVVDIQPQWAARPIGGTDTWTVTVTNGYHVTVSNLTIIDEVYHHSAILCSPETLDFIYPSLVHGKEEQNRKANSSKNQIHNPL